jgi:2'-5' RNA ligase
VAAVNLHLTLRFLGAVRRETLDRLAAGLRAVRRDPFEVRLGEVGTFGRGSAVRVVWLGVEEGKAALAGLAGLVEAECRDAGLEPEPRPYNPHLTLGRVRERRGNALPELPQPPAVAPWTVAGFHLYQSRLGPSGAVHSVLEDFGPWPGHFPAD